jgi:hypothetical protein
MQGGSEPDLHSLIAWWWDWCLFFDDCGHHKLISSTASQSSQTSTAPVQAALDGGGKANISVIVIHIKAALGAQAVWAG